jgi:radical SAM superfamily enzyme YgiQ (UPF0313 family)
MKILVANPPGVMYWFTSGSVQRGSTSLIRQFVKSGSRWSHTLHIGEEPVTPGYMPFPFSLAYLTAMLKSHSGVTVKGIDGCAEVLNYDTFYDIVSKFKPELMIVEIPFVTWQPDFQMFEAIAYDLNSKLIVVGAFADYIKQHAVRKFKNFVHFISGAYEHKVMSYLTQLKHVNDFNLFPFPDRVDFKPELYHDFSIYEPNIQMLTSRGCPQNCGFCIERQLVYPKYQNREAQKVVDEMEFCIERYGAKQFYFDDMSFTISDTHVEGICSEMVNRDIGVPFTAMADHKVSKRSLEKMAGAGCLALKIGIESASDTVLDNIPKTIDFNKVMELQKACTDLGIRLHGTFMFGCMGETKESMQQTLDFAMEVEFDSVQFAIATPYPNTPFYEQVKDYLNTDNPMDFDGNFKCVIDYPDLSGEEIFEFHKYACKQWRKKAMRRKIQRGFRHPLRSLKKIRSIGRAIKGAF